MKVQAKILWIQGKRAVSPPFVTKLRKKNFLVEIVETGNEAYDRLSVSKPDVVVLNASSMRTSGKRICQTLKKKAQEVPVLVISDHDLHSLDDLCANEILLLPFTSRKLLNRLLPLLPGEGNNVYKVGVISLDLDRNLVSCEKKETTLTPRLAELLLTLMENNGDVIERDELFRKVWNTEYTVDTRTLDVHMSWLRQAIEEEPRHPKFIKTIRGVGYRLDV
jgi:DNA-binding response OmpR family regulator